MPVAKEPLPSRRAISLSSTARPVWRHKPRIASVIVVRARLQDSWKSPSFSPTTDCSPSSWSVHECKTCHRLSHRHNHRDNARRVVRSGKKPFLPLWAPGDENWADHFAKHRSPAHHQVLKPVFLNEAERPADLQGCAELLKHLLGKRPQDEWPV